MTEQECKQLIMICEATYPNFRASDPAATLKAWHMIIGEYDYQTMLMALKMYIHTSGSAFAPSVSELIAMTRKPQELCAQTEVDVWREVRPAIRNGLYHFEEEYEKLSETAKKMVGDPQQLREWAMLPSEDIDTVVQSNFKKRYETMIKRDAEISAMPREVREMIGTVGQKQIGVSE